MMTLTLGSLFTGIGGLDLGLERAGFQVAWQVEIDNYANRVLEKHWPNVPRHRDVRDVGARNLAPVDLIAGGFPCQDLSQAGSKAGLAGERSGLWFEFYRIICELRPRYILVENVPDLLDRGLDTILGGLATCGYDAEWECLPAAALGAPHQRDRLFLVAYTNSELHRHRHDGACTVFPSRPTSHEALRAALSNPEPWAVEPAVDRVAYGVPFGVDQLGGLGNAVVPQLGELIGRWIVDFDQRRQGGING